RTDFYDPIQRNQAGQVHQLDQLYRIRPAKADEWHLEKRSLFHIPFNERHKVARQRYSIPGLPCLYLGGTLYVCWLEMNRPNFDSLFISRFRVTPGETVSVLDLGMRPRNIARRISEWKSNGALTT